MILYWSAALRVRPPRLPDPRLSEFQRLPGNPIVSQNSSPSVFEMGLVMAGAASAGTYTAGVVDFLIEALQAWEEAKAAGDPRIPDHAVRLRVAAGASAGGIMGSLLSMLPFTGHFPVSDLSDATRASDVANGERNLLYRCWVSRTDIRRMLATDDLQGDPAKVASLLNGQVLAEIAQEAVETVRAALLAEPSPPSYFANPLQLYVSLTNMRGIPYVIRMIADERMRGHLVRSHCDYAHFAVLNTGAWPAGPLPPGSIPVNRPVGSGALAADGWDLIRDAALATSAFPCGFPARPFRIQQSAYHERKYVGAAAEPEDIVALSVQIDLPETPGATYDFWCVDGGLLNNEPMEYVCSALFDPSGERADDASRADRALLMIDPFPSDGGAAAQPKAQAPDLLDALFALIPMLRANAAFKPRELKLALDEQVRSRYLITPVRETTLPPQTELASAGLAGFAGFVHEQLRMHDFQLGRRNCQKFLRDHFYVHVDNPIVQAWVRRMQEQGGVPERYHPVHSDTYGRQIVRSDLVQIIPLMQSVHREVPLRPWPKLDRDRDFEPVREMIRRRADATIPELTRALLLRAGVGDDQLISRALRAIACDVITSRVGHSLADAVERDLLTRGLL